MAARVLKIVSWDPLDVPKDVTKVLEAVVTVQAGRGTRRVLWDQRKKSKKTVIGHFEVGRSRLISRVNEFKKSVTLNML